MEGWSHGTTEQGPPGVRERAVRLAVDAHRGTRIQVAVDKVGGGEDGVHAETLRA